MFVLYLYVLFNLFIHHSYWPDEWNHLLIAPVLKGGKDPLDPTSYRPIHLTSVIAKLLAQVIESKLRNDVPRSPEQMGFSPAHGTRDNMFVLSTLFDKYKCSGMYCAFVDFKGAFDSVDRSLLMTKLYGHATISEPVRRMVAAMYSNVTASVKGSSDWFFENIGVKQGDPLGPRLFNIFIHDLPDFLFPNGASSVECDGVFLSESLVKCLLYADDLVLFSTTAEGLQRQLDRLHEYCRTWLLTVNVSKTECMFVKQHKDTSITPPVLTYGGCALSYVRTFKYMLARRFVKMVRSVVMKLE